MLFRHVRFHLYLDQLLHSVLLFRAGRVLLQQKCDSGKACPSTGDYNSTCHHRCSCPPFQRLCGNRRSSGRTAGPLLGLYHRFYGLPLEATNTGQPQ